MLTEKYVAMISRRFYSLFSALSKSPYPGRALSNGIFGNKKSDEQLSVVANYNSS